ncbi:MAG: OB-fold nucleic acid binding domain-containing protein [Candidatus Aenigmarchaeota archaeon]|nr:OB-fold nucleic acid binding domain-containing protein [Candidatus Aenigmarchaeota archaeon]
MIEKDLRNVSLILSIAGLVVLFIGVNYADVSTNISDIDNNYIGKVVSVKGEISSYFYNGKHLFFDIQDDTGKIRVVFFENVMKNQNIDPNRMKNGDVITVRGNVENYKGRLEIVGERLE